MHVFYYNKRVKYKRITLAVPMQQKWAFIWQIALNISLTV